MKDWINDNGIAPSNHQSRRRLINLLLCVAETLKKIS